MTAIHVASDPSDVARMKEHWERWGGPVNLVILESPYRALMAPLMAYIDATDSGIRRNRPPFCFPSSCRATSGSTRFTTRPPFD